MKINFDEIMAAFPNKAWVYAEQYDSVKIGKWERGIFTFHEPLDEKYLTVLRVFNSHRELKFTGDKLRDTAMYKNEDYISELAHVQYYMYGEQSELIGEFTKLREDRGGVIYFPGELNFQKKDEKDIVALKLGIKHFVRYNPVTVLPKCEKYDFGLSVSGSGALEVVDYAYTGFYYDYESGKAVEL